MSGKSVIFFGTPQFAKEILAFLLEHNVNVVAVVTGIDKPRGRAQKLQPTEVKDFVQTQYPHIPVFQPPKASDPAFVEKMASYAPDIFVVVSYGQILRQPLLDVPKYAINVHPSLLPLYRGPSPIRSPLLHGDAKTGVTIMEMVLEMDAGDILSQEEFPIPATMVHGELEEHLCLLSCRLLLEVLRKIDRGERVLKVPQDHKKMTLTKKTVSEDLKLDFTKTAREVHRCVAAFSPTPGAWAMFSVQGKEKRIKILRTEETLQNSLSPGETIAFDRNQGWIISCKDRGLKILEIQPEGSKIMQVKEFMNGISSPPIFFRN